MSSAKKKALAYAGAFFSLYKRNGDFMGYKSEIIKKIKEGAKIKITGDSLSAGTGSSCCVRTDEVVFKDGEDIFYRKTAPNSWGGLFAKYISEKYPCSSVINKGCDGANTTQLLNNFDKIVDEDDDIVILLAGANDRKRPDGLHELYDNLIKFTELMEKKGKILVLASLNPSTESNEFYINRIHHSEDIETILTMVADEKNLLFVDNYRYIQNYLVASGKKIDDIICCEGCKNDGLHPGDFVQKLMYMNLMETLGFGIRL